jgi:hypothetical protein
MQINSEVVMKDKEVKSRFSISEIREEIELQKSIELIKEVREKARIAKQEAKIAKLEKIAQKEKLLQEKESELFIEEFGRKLLESAVKGYKSLEVFHITHYEGLLIKMRGFNISEKGIRKVFFN